MKIQRSFGQNTKNPMINIFDIEGLSKISKSNNLLFVVDNTFASPYLQNPLNLGADIVMHSATKYLAAIVMCTRALMLNDDKLLKNYILFKMQVAVPDLKIVLTLRELKHYIRMQRHCENALKVAFFK